MRCVREHCDMSGSAPEVTRGVCDVYGNVLLMCRTGSLRCALRTF